MRLALLGRRQAAQDEADVRDEAEVEHAVGLVEHQHLRVAQVEHVLLEVVDEAARACRSARRRRPASCSRCFS